MGSLFNQYSINMKVLDIVYRISLRTLQPTPLLLLSFSNHQLQPQIIVGGFLDATMSLAVMLIRALCNVDMFVSYQLPRQPIYYVTEFSRIWQNVADSGRMQQNMVGCDRGQQRLVEVSRNLVEGSRGLVEGSRELVAGSRCQQCQKNCYRQ